MRYYISDQPPNAKRFAQAVRGHWSIENSQHWVLDVAFREDDRRQQDRKTFFGALTKYVTKEEALLVILDLWKRAHERMDGVRPQSGWMKLCKHSRLTKKLHRAAIPQMMPNQSESQTIHDLKSEFTGGGPIAAVVNK